MGCLKGIDFGKENHVMNIEKNGIVYFCRMPEQTGWNGHETAVKMLKYGFREFFQTEFKEEAVLKHADGKPYYGINPNLKFNISHCKDGVAVVLSDREVGVDVESMRQVNGRVVKKCCSRDEADYVYGEMTGAWERKKESAGEFLQEAEAERFLHLWTLKESYVKMTGEGLRAPFHRVCFFPWDLQKEGGTEGTEIKGFAEDCRHYLYCSGGLILALTVQWVEKEGEPDFLWKELRL